MSPRAGKRSAVSLPSPPAVTSAKQCNNPFNLSPTPRDKSALWACPKAAGKPVSFVPERVQQCVVCWAVSWLR